MGLVVWVAIFVLNILFLCCYVDDCFGVTTDDDLETYEPYQMRLARVQVALLRLWDFLGLPHGRRKQFCEYILDVIGFLIDPNALTATLPPESKSELIQQVRMFANSRRRTLHEWQQLAGWMNWSLNVFPLYRPALCNVYAKMRGKSNQSALIFVNKAVRDDLLWFADHVENSSGVFFFANIDWNPLVEADLEIYGDACLTGLGFWVPADNLGLSALVDQGSEMAHLIFYWEAITVLAAIHHITRSPNPRRGTAERPFRLTIRSDSSNTVNIFNSLHAQPTYNPILTAAVEPDTRWSGQSMQAGGATAMAEDGAPPHIIQATGRWASDAFQFYIRKNPVVLNAMLAAQRRD
ncbi:hypothetical protein D9757_014248 [Collybiopsis confluens]|uniref:RNase H type-1 domain-containing protein n=1 Tax=Collybiopsis confluens TaxID=2823264 RepID=A0A8H5G5V2_9AGAR|nr:hypothetical protein D9757_014248 [Collybiopsis confluens]